MAWTQLGYSRSQVDKAGALLARGDGTIFEESEALTILNNWRASHAFPLNTMQMGLRRRAMNVDRDAVVAQRLKRVPSILQKISRFPEMRLSRMQDIGGCRAVVRSIEEARAIIDGYKSSKVNHPQTGEKDYVANPKESGYRCFHLVYKYKSDRNETYNAHQIELQIRSQIQHAWATAVETVGTFLGQALKSSVGSEEWLRFFALTSSMFAHVEGTPPLAGSPPVNDLISEVKRMSVTLNVNPTLTAYRHTLATIEDPKFRDSHYFLMLLAPSEGRLEITGYKQKELQIATEQYLKLESELDGKTGVDVVLVSTGHLDALRKAYPNYFLDTEAFLREFDNAVA